MLQQKKPRDYVVSTGRQYSVKQFAELAFKLAGLDYKKYVKIDKKLERPADVLNLLGDCKKAKKDLKWKQKFTFKELVKDMVENDIKFVKKEGY